MVQELFKFSFSVCYFSSKFGTAWYIFFLERACEGNCGQSWAWLKRNPVICGCSVCGTSCCVGSGGYYMEWFLL